MTLCPAPGSIPRLVQNATALAEHLGFSHSCTPDVGRLLRLLAAGVRDGVVAEIGTGCGAKRPAPGIGPAGGQSDHAGYFGDASLITKIGF